MSRWALIVEENVGQSGNRHWEARVLRQVSGTHEEAMAALWTHALHFLPRHPLRVGRRRVFRDGPDGFIVINDGSMNDYPCRFRCCELLWDTEVQGWPGGDQD